MSDLFEDPIDDTAPGDNAPEFTVSELSGAVKKTIEGGFARVRVRGEVGRVSRPRSGHLYMDLKDDRSVLAGVIWKGVAGRLETQPEEGLEVIVTGKLTTFPGQSKYQIVIDSVAPAGVGALMAMLEKRKKALEAEGLFAPERKKDLPYLPEVIGVVTSPSGAVIRDILHRLRDRFPRKVLIWPVAVQGTRCAPEVTAAINGFNAMTPGGALPRPDLLIVARGGGSIEDLWGFNEESVARAAAASEIPLISAVGHETDTTLIDYVSDRRAPTPTAAAELAVPVRAELLAWTSEQEARLTGALVRSLQMRGQRLRDLARALPRAEDLTRPAAQRLDYLAERLPRALSGGVDRRHRELSRVGGALRPATLLGQIRAEAQRLERLNQRLEAGVRALHRDKARSLRESAARLSLRAAARTISEAPVLMARQASRLDTAYRNLLATRRARLEGLERVRLSIGYESTLKRGYAVVRAGDRVIMRAGDARDQHELGIQFQDGTVDVRISDAPRAAPRSSTPKKRKPPQKSLFED